jgi:hypothetical protein
MQPPDKGALKWRYGRLSNDALLERSLSAETLTESARHALASELKARGLRESDAQNYADYLQRAEILNPRMNQGAPIASQANGCGSTLLNRRSNGPDGSYVVTKWLTVFWIPIWPLLHMRIRPTSDGYTILGVSRPWSNIEP